MLVTAPPGWGYTPAAGRRRRLGLLGAGISPVSAVVAWTGREMIGWGVLRGRLQPGGAFNPLSNATMTLAAARLAPRQPAAGVWTGTELIIAGGADVNGRPFCSGAAYSPATNRWRTLPRMPRGNWSNSVAVWTGTRLLVSAGSPRPSGPARRVARARGVAYTPTTNRWSSLPASPLKGNLRRLTGVWTDRQMLVWSSSGVAAAFRPRTP